MLNYLQIVALDKGPRFKAGERIQNRRYGAATHLTNSEKTNFIIERLRILVVFGKKHYYSSIIDYQIFIIGY